MKVRATKPCFVDGHRRRPGEVFHYEPPKGGGKLPPFMERVAEDAETGRARPVAGPPKTDTMAAMARRRPTGPLPQAAAPPTEGGGK